MTRSENLSYMVGIDRTAVVKLLDDVTEEESMIRGEGNMNHIRWLTGHLVYETNVLLVMVGCTPVALPENYRGLFCAGSEVSEDSSAYPSMATLRGQLYELHDKVASAVAALPEEDLDQRLPKEIGFDASKLQAATFMCMHTFYHCGQIAVMRRILGRPRAFR